MEIIQEEVAPKGVKKRRFTLFRASLVCFVVFTLLWARIAAKFANKASAKTLNRATGIVLVILGLAIFLFSQLS